MDQLPLDFKSNIKTKTFNQEIIWDSKKPLFEMYFKEEIIKTKYRLSNLEIDKEMTFEEALKYLKFV